eukprot:Opistho-2@36437
MEELHGELRSGAAPCVPVTVLVKTSATWTLREWTHVVQALKIRCSGRTEHASVDYANALAIGSACVAVFLQPHPALVQMSTELLDAAMSDETSRLEHAVDALGKQLDAIACDFGVGHAQTAAVLERVVRIARGAHMIRDVIASVAHSVRARLIATLSEAHAHIFADSLVAEHITCTVSGNATELLNRPSTTNGRIDRDVQRAVATHFRRATQSLTQPSRTELDSGMFENASRLLPVVVFAVVPDLLATNRGSASQGCTDERGTATGSPHPLPPGEEVAAYFAACVGARSVEVWGADDMRLFTARTPSQFPQTSRLLYYLDYREAKEIATCDADIVHPACIDVLLISNIPLLIFGVSHLFQYNEGTHIGGRLLAGCSRDDDAATPVFYSGVKAVRVQRAITLVSMATIDMWRTIGFLSRIFACFERMRVSIDLVSTSETNVTVSLDAVANAVDPRRMAELLRELNQHCRVTVIEPCAVISLIGCGVGACHEGLAVAARLGAHVYLVSKSADDVSLSMVVDEHNGLPLEAALHDVFFGEINASTATFGPSYSDLEHFERPGAQQRTPFVNGASATWWRDRADEIVRTAPADSPLYMYNVPTLIAAADQLTSTLKSVDRFFFAVKANPNPDILRILKDRGFGFECVSLGELQLASAILGSRSSMVQHRILFTPNFASRLDYETAFASGCHVTVDGLFPLERWPGCFANRSIILRVDANNGRGHHSKVVTAGGNSKFGIPVAQMQRCADLCKQARVCVIGLHSHAGSGVISTPNVWGDTLSLLRHISREHFGNSVQIFNVGGGLGVPDKPSVRPIDLTAVEQELAASRSDTLFDTNVPFECKTSNSQPSFEVWMEPGRYLVAECGVLLCRVTQTKDKGESGRRYVGVNAGMNALIRPALYGSHHAIVNASRVLPSGEYAPQPMSVFDVVGPICESGDVLGTSRACLLQLARVMFSLLSVLVRMDARWPQLIICGRFLTKSSSGLLRRKCCLDPEIVPEIVGDQINLVNKPY